MQINCAHTEVIDLDLLVPNPKNPNKHPDSQIKLLAKIMMHQGWRAPIVVSTRSGFITKGHGRLMAAKLNGWREVPIDRQDYQNEADEYADMVADNKLQELSETDMSMVNTDVLDLGPDFDTDLLGIPGFEVEPADRLDPEAADDEVPENVEPRSKLGDIYLLGAHRLLCGDATNPQHVDQLLDGQKIDLCFTDPPYGISVVSKDGSLGGGTYAGKYKQVMNDHDTEAAESALNLCLALEIPHLLFWGANHYSSKTPDSPCWIVWDKQAGKKITFADCELAWTNLNAPARIITHVWDGFRRDSEWGIARVHPTQKPVELIGEIFKAFFENDQLVLDLFGGSGSTLIACEKSERQCFMMELDPHYCDVIVARWEKYTGRKAELQSEAE